ncbi:MAG: MoaD family protein [Candidatus Bathyarchaeota archaeon]|nr:MAG: MoaD family protein [Candidatus Bathyarchaeota archaeon]
MAITVKFLGVLRHISGADQLALNIEEAISIKKLMNEIVREMPALKQSLIHQQLEDLRSNILILVNGREISALNDFETNLKDGDTIALVPVVHGG